jgi:hypothetical protein
MDSASVNKTGYKIQPLRPWILAYSEITAQTDRLNSGFGRWQFVQWSKAG